MSKIKIASARLSFPSLFQTSVFSGEDTGKYEATFILDKVEHAETIKGIQAQIDHLLKTELKGKLPSDKICLKDGDESGRPEFEGKMTVKASTKRRPLVINRDKSPSLNPFEIRASLKPFAQKILLKTSTCTGC